MAKIYPSVSRFEPMRTASENFVLNKIRQALSDDWTVYLNLEFTRSEKRFWVEGEMDFLLYHEIYGILILEVKGGILSKRGEQWFQCEKPCAKDPWQQVARQKRYLLDHLKRFSGEQTMPFAIAGIPCFPDSEWNKNLPLESRGNALWKSDLSADLEERIIEILRLSHSRKQTHYAGWFPSDLVHCALASLAETAERLRDHTQEEKEQFLALTQEQGRILSLEICGEKRFRVVGGAGTGKTVIAVEKAKRLARSGKNVLLFCYNLLLSQTLKASTANMEKLTTEAFSVFARRVLNISDEERDAIPQAEKTRFFAELPLRLLEHLKTFPQKFDAVIVDEGQDFSPEMWKAIEELTTPDGHFVVFYDPNQNLFYEETHLPESLNACKEFRLSHNCRNTKRIHEKIQEAIPDGTSTLPGSPVGEDVMVFRPGTPEEARKNLEDAIHALRTRSIPERNITILGARAKPEETFIGNDTTLDGFRIVSPENSKRKKGTIEYYTCMRFKGCESNTLILIDVEPNSFDWTNCKLYTSTSRASNRLIVIYAPAKKTAYF